MGNGLLVKVCIFKCRCKVIAFHPTWKAIVAKTNIRIFFWMRIDFEVKSKNTACQCPPILPFYKVHFIIGNRSGQSA